jgi:hypothetical protein
VRIPNSRRRGDTPRALDLDPAPKAGSVTTHDGKTYRVQPFPLYSQQQSTADVTITLEFIEVAR